MPLSQDDLKHKIIAVASGHEPQAVIPALTRLLMSLLLAGMVATVFFCCQLNSKLIMSNSNLTAQQRTEAHDRAKESLLTTIAEAPYEEVLHAVLLYALCDSSTNNDILKDYVRLMHCVREYKALQPRE